MKWRETLEFLAAASAVLVGYAAFIGLVTYVVATVWLAVTR
jgi:hypothetical protein